MIRRWLRRLFRRRVLPLQIADEATWTFLDELQERAHCQTPTQLMIAALNVYDNLLKLEEAGYQLYVVPLDEVQHVPARENWN